jgi:hypothetical protein
MKIIFESEGDAEAFCEKLGDLLVDLKCGFPSFHVKSALYRFLLRLDISIEEGKNA